MPDARFAPVFSALKPALERHAPRFSVQQDADAGYSLVTRTPSPFPQHKGRPLPFASLSTGKAYVSFHLMPVYMNPGVAAHITPALKKRMQGKACFNFKTPPEPELLADLDRLISAALEDWRGRKWL